ncbi:MAG: ribonuclease P protein component [Planctomycetes bacterium]|nr:ribonuclease P protein component [Planctomycetota bacterium]
MSFNFPKSAKLLKTSEFDRVFSARSSAANRLIIVHAARSPCEQPRLGLTVSRKCGNAVVRNRWKRSIREAFRLVQHELPRHFDFVVIPKRGATPNVADLQESLLKLTKKIAARQSATNASKKAER